MERNKLIVVGMCGALAALLICVSEQDVRAASSELPDRVRIIDFGSGAPPWTSIDDVVMGGRSSSEMTVRDGVAVFSGTVSLENNGGFASVRSSSEIHDLSDFEGLLVRLRGDSKRFALRIRTTEDFGGVSYQVKIHPPKDEWTVLFLPFVDFEPVFRGRRVRGHPPLDPAQIRSFGLLISDGQQGSFKLEIAWLAASNGESE
jgi:monofunctional biosynthetic peptidoglycan transglycosylase